MQLTLWQTLEGFLVCATNIMNRRASKLNPENPVFCQPDSRRLDEHQLAAAGCAFD